MRFRTAAFAALAASYLLPAVARADDFALCADRERARDYAASVAACDRLLAAAGGDVERSVLFMNRGVVRSRSGDAKGGAEDNETALRLDPKNPTARLNGILGRVREGENVDGAIVEVDGIVAERPKLAFAYGTRANLKRVRKDFDGAMSDAGIAIRLDPKDPLLYRIRAQILRAMGRHEAALEDAGRCLELDPKDPAALRLRGGLFAEKGDFEGAYNDFHDAAELAPGNQGGRLARALSVHFDGAPALALKEVRAAVAIDPTRPYPAIWLELMLRKAGQPGELAKNRDRLALKGWPAPIVKFLLGEMSPEDAVRAAKHPDDPRKEEEENCEATVYIAEASRIEGNMARARKLYGLARKTCPVTFLERTAAFLALRDPAVRE